MSWGNCLSKPYIVEADGKEVAVLLMDTQGTFDEWTTYREWSSIVGLSLLTSSIMIFNSFTNIQEDVLAHLETYVEYGLLAVEAQEDEDARPFQKLVFLVRDWNNPGEFPYGHTGGKKFIKEKLQVKRDQPRQAQEVRRKIRKCFNEIDCFILPDPGEKAKQGGFNGALAHLDTKFAKKIEECVNDLLSPESLVVKEVQGGPVRASEFFHLFKTYVDIFNRDDLPTPMTLVEATNLIAAANFIKRLIAVYTGDMKKVMKGKKYIIPKKLKQSHEKALKKCTKEFSEFKSIEDGDIVKNLEKQLKNDINLHYESFKKSNEDKKAKFIEAAKKEAYEEFDAKIEEELEDGFLNDKKFDSIAESAIEECLTDFKEKVEDTEENEDDILDIVKQNLMKQKERWASENSSRERDARAHNVSIINSMVASYIAELTEKLNGDEYLEDKEIAQFETEVLEKAAIDFNNKDLKGGKKFTADFKQQLNCKMEAMLKEQKELNDLKKKTAESSVDSLIQELAGEFEKKLQVNVSVDDDNFDTVIKEQAEKLGPTIIEKFESKCRLAAKTPLRNVKKDALIALIDERKIQLKKNFEAKKEEVEAKYQEAVEIAVENYKKSMKSFLSEKSFYDEEKLMKKHEELEHEATSDFENHVKSVSSTNEEQHRASLTGKLETLFLSSLEENQESKKAAIVKMENDVKNCLNEYETKLTGDLDAVIDEAEFKEKSKNHLKAAVDQLRDLWKNLEDPSLLDHHIQKLEKEAMETFEDDIMELYNMKKEEHQNLISKCVTEAKKLYYENMRKHLDNHEFLPPKKFQRLHRATAIQAIEYCKKKIPMTSAVGSELETQIDKLRDVFEELNDMDVQADPAIGIDLGTTFSCVAVYLKGKVQVIPNRQGKNTTPSYVAFPESGDVVVGEAAKSQAHENPENTIFDAKRMIGRRIGDEKLVDDMKLWPFEVQEDTGVPKILAGGKLYYPEQVSSKVLIELKEAAQDFLGCEVKNAVITVPAYFNDGQRQATKDAGELAGLNVLTIINEPTAAAMAYKLQYGKEADGRNVLIYDLGGGTFDVAVLEVSPGELNVKAVGGDTHLGGEDFDNNLVDHCLAEFQNQHGIDLAAERNSSDMTKRQKTMRILRRIRNECEKQKVNLSSMAKVDICVDAIYGNQDMKVSCSRDQFEEMNKDLFTKSLEIMEKCLVDGNIDKDSIDDIVLVGGSTRIPKIRELLTDYFEKSLSMQVNADEAVAIGAAMKAAITNGQIAKGSMDFTQIKDVTPMTLGIEVLGGDFSEIIYKNTQIPCSRTEQYSTSADNQTKVKVTIYQGEHCIAKKNVKLGEFIMEGIPPGKAGEEKVDVKMDIDDQGILHVSAMSTSSGSNKQIEIKEYRDRLSAEDIQKILAEA